jgi:transposase
MGWKKQGAALQDHHVSGTIKFGGGSLMMWGCMTSKGVGFSCKIDGTMNSKLYTNILSDELELTLEYYQMDHSDIIFQQDNDPKHTSKRAKEWFQEHEIKVLPWPPQSPDLNPIEHLWHHLKRRLSGYENEPKSMSELWERVEREWNEIPLELCVNLIESMPNRVAAVIKSKGGHTKY